MQRIKLRSIAAASVVVALAAASISSAARRPRYGGELRVEFRAVLPNLNPTETPDDPDALALQRQLIPAVFETLVRLDDRGNPQPWLATGWTRDRERKSWVFAVRQNVVFHDGAPWSPPGGSVSVPDNRPIEEILRDLARPRNAVTARAADGTLVGTGPFRVREWEPGKPVVLAAHDAYWGGRPYLDTIRIQMGRTFAEQASDFQLGMADVVELALKDLKTPKPRGVSVFATQPMETLALRFEDARVPDSVREALALSIDRAAIHNVLLQRQGEVSAALLPQWLSGYSFLFSVERNLARARQIAPAPSSLTFAYDRQDALVRPIAERIAVNANEAGITLRTSNAAAVRLLRLPITSRDPMLALEDLAAILKTPLAGMSSYEIEQTLTGGFRVIPLVQLPRGSMLSARVKNWPKLADVWLDGGVAP